MRHNAAVPPPLFQARHLRKRYGSATVVDDLSFEIAPGECLGVIGPNGAGKTTTIRMCLGLTAPDEGRIEALGGLSMPHDARAIKAQLGVVSQFDTLDPDFSCAENLIVYARYFGIGKKAMAGRVPKLLEFAALSHKASAKPGELSGGMRRRLSLARASCGMTWPSASMRPASGSVRPRHMRMVVVLPAPLGPITPRHSPGAM